MGLDQLAFSRPPTAKNDKSDEQLVSWRKHPNLQGWMERLWRKQKYGDAAIPGVNARAATADSLVYSKDTYMDNPFNQEEVEPTLDDIKRLRLDIVTRLLTVDMVTPQVSSSVIHQMNTTEKPISNSVTKQKQL